jgi:hypothetical protein
MGPRLVVQGDPHVEVSLWLVHRAVDPSAEGDAVELVEHRAVEALADAVGLRAPRLGLRVVNVLDRQIKLRFVAIARTAVLSVTMCLASFAATNRDGCGPQIVNVESKGRFGQERRWDVVHTMRDPLFDCEVGLEQKVTQLKERNLV